MPLFFFCCWSYFDSMTFHLNGTSRFASVGYCLVLQYDCVGGYCVVPDSEYNWCISTGSHTVCSPSGVLCSRTTSTPPTPSLPCPPYQNALSAWKIPGRGWRCTLSWVPAQLPAIHIHTLRPSSKSTPSAAPTVLSDSDHRRLGPLAITITDRREKRDHPDN